MGAGVSAGALGLGRMCTAAWSLCGKSPGPVFLAPPGASDGVGMRHLVVRGDPADPFSEYHREYHEPNGAKSAR